jgi:predicted amidohydrolase
LHRCTTGAAHWEILLRARAIETQSYVIAAAQCGEHSEKRQSYGEERRAGAGAGAARGGEGRGLHGGGGTHVGGE